MYTLWPWQSLWFKLSWPYDETNKSLVIIHLILEQNTTNELIIFYLKQKKNHIKNFNKNSKENCVLKN